MLQNILVTMPCRHKEGESIVNFSKTCGLFFLFCRYFFHTIYRCVDALWNYLNHEENLISFVKNQYCIRKLIYSKFEKLFWCENNIAAIIFVGYCDIRQYILRNLVSSLFGFTYMFHFCFIFN